MDPVYILCIGVGGIIVVVFGVMALIKIVKYINKKRRANVWLPVRN